MRRLYVEITLYSKNSRWFLESCPTEFVEMTGFSAEIISERFDNEFLLFFSQNDSVEVNKYLTNHSNSFLQVNNLKNAYGYTICVHIQELQVDSALTDEMVRVCLLDVTEQAKRCSALEARVDFLERACPGGLCQVLMDEQLTIIWHNQGFLDILGYTKRQFVEELHHCAKGYIYPQDIEIVAKQFNELNGKIGESEATEFRIVRRDGEVRTIISLFSSLGETHNGTPVFYSAGMDITDNKRAQQLEWDAERFRIAMKQTSSCVWEYNIPDRRILATESFQEFMGVDRDIENVPDSMIESKMVDTDSVSSFLQFFEKICSGEEEAECTIRLKNCSKEYVWVKISMTGILDEMGMPLKAIALMEDISEKYCLELRYREEEKRRIALTFDQIFACQINLSENKVLQANEKTFPSATEKHSCASALIQENARNFVHPDDQEEYLKVFSQQYLMDHFEQRIPELTLEYRALISEGVYRWQQASMHTVQEPSRGDLWTYVYVKDINKQKMEELELRRNAERDGLTGLYNRQSMEFKCKEYLKNMITDQQLVMLSLDLDGFKHVNDTFGHTCGDEVLKQIAQIFHSIFSKEEALCGRLGGDEFLILLFEYTSEEAVNQRAQILCDEIYEQLSSAYGISASIGISIAPVDGVSYESLYQCADVALYHAKNLGKNQYVFYNENIITKQHQDKIPVSREWLLDEASDIIYVADINNYDLLYMNKKMRQLFDQDEKSYQGKKCFTILQGFDRPCEFCNNHLLSRDAFYHWKYYNPLIGQYLSIKDRLVDWYGRPARIEFANDVTEIDHCSKHLEEQMQIDETILGCYRLFHGSRTFGEALEGSFEAVGNLYQADRVFLLKHDKQTKENEVGYFWIREGVAPLTIEKNQWNQILTKFNDDQKEDFYQMNDLDLLKDENANLYKLYEQNAIFCQRALPLYFEGELVGMIGLDNPTKLLNELTVLEILGDCVAEKYSKILLAKRLNDLGTRDRLTGLQNRESFFVFTSELMVKPIQTLGVMVADLNSLGEINRTCGYEEGDQVIQAVAAHLKEVFLPELVFRLSGDEFLAVDKDCCHDKFLSHVQSMYHSAKNTYGISVGYAWSDDKHTFMQLMDQAREMMLLRKQTHYKKLGKPLLRSKHGHSRIQPVLDAIKNREYIMYLQPKVNCITGKMTGAEALARYDSPKHGFKMPSQFISELERNYTIKYLDLFILEEVCGTLAHWRQNGLPFIPISLNLSRQTLLEPELMQTIQSIVDSFQIPRKFIELEITESLGDYADQTIAEIGSSIKSAGFRLALDDFGSHYTNMSILTKLPPNTLKIDRSLVKDLLGNHSNKLLLQYLLAFCKEMGIQSVVEGVEEEKQRDLLQSLGCDEIQGYLFGKPVTLKEFEQKFLMS